MNRVDPDAASYRVMIAEPAELATVRFAFLQRFCQVYVGFAFQDLIEGYLIQQAAQYRCFFHFHNRSGADVQASGRL
jgi:hypothetical protein